MPKPVAAEAGVPEHHQIPPSAQPKFVKMLIKYVSSSFANNKMVFAEVPKKKQMKADAGSSDQSSYSHRQGNRA